MQDQLDKQRGQIQSHSLSRIISVKKNIPSPNRILPKAYQNSKPSSHYFNHFNVDIISVSGQMQLLYNQSQENMTLNIKQNLVKYLCQAQGLKQQSSIASVALKNFFLNKPQQIQFLSITALQALNDLPQTTLCSSNLWQSFQLILKALIRTNFPIIKLNQKKNCQQKKCVPSKPIQQITQNSLTFNDEFQSSNLLVVKQIPKFKNTYFLCTRFDYNTISYGQWFYFKIKNLDKQNNKSNYKFVICNMTKRSSMLGKSLKISVCRKNIWGKQGQDISYYRSPFKRTQKVTDHQNFYILQFNLEISAGQQIFVSYNEPYTYTRLIHLVDQIGTFFFQQENEHNPERICFKKTLICQTALKNNMECLSFTKKNTKKIQQKKVIFILARAHPIQTAGSFVIQGILKQIFKIKLKQKNDKEKNTQNEQFYAIENLMQKFIIKIIAMINPDGVILGNSRCNFSGYDLNRQWKKPTIQNSRQIYYLKKFIMKYEGRIEMFIDLHGHSKKKNVFAYGLHDSKNPFATRQFPYLLSKLSPIDFLFQECRFTKIFRISEQNQSKQVKSKQGTARINLWKKLNIRNIFTIQNSYCSSSYRNYHYDCSIYNQIGKHILQAIGMYFLQYKYEKKVRNKQKNNNNNNSIDINVNISLSQQNGEKGVSEIQKQLKQIRKTLITDLKSKKQNITIGLEEILSSQSQEQIRNDDFQNSKNKQKQTNKVQKNRQMQKAQSNKQFKSKINKKQIKTNHGTKHSLTQSKQQKNNSQYQSYKFKTIDVSQQQISLGHYKMKSRNQQNNQKRQEKIKIKVNPATRLYSSTKGNYQEDGKQPRQNRLNTLSIIQIGWKDDSTKLIKSSRTISTYKIRSNVNCLANLQVLRPIIIKKQKQEGRQDLHMLKQLKQRQYQMMEKQKFMQKTEIQRKHKYQNFQTRKYQQIKEIISKINRIPYPGLNKFDK